MGGPAEDRRARAQERVLRQAIADLTAEVHDLQAQLAALAEVREAQRDGAARVPAAAASATAPPPASGPSAVLRRLGKGAIRGTVGAVRRVWRAADPAQRYVVAPRLVGKPVDSLPVITVVVDAAVRPDRSGVLRELARQTAPPAEVVFWDRRVGSVARLAADGSDLSNAPARTDEELRASVGGDFLIEVPAGLRGVPSTWLESLQWLLASEQLAFVRAFASPVDEDDIADELLGCARSLWRQGGVDFERLVQAAAARPVVGKTVGLAGRLDAAVPRLASLGRDSREVVCRTGRYDVWAGNRAGPVEHRLRPIPPLEPGEGSAPETVLVLVAAPLVGGSAGVVGEAVRSLRDRLRFVVASTAADHRIGVARALALEGLGATVYELGTTLQAEVWPSAVARIASRYRPATALVVGDDSRLAPVLSDLRASGVRIAALASGGSAPLDGVDVRLVGDGIHGGEDRGVRRGGTQLAVAAGWLVPDQGSVVSEPRRAAIRRELGIPPERRLVVTATDLVPTGRPEDVVVVADRLRGEPDVSFVLIGDGQLAGTVVDLIGFLGVHNVRLRRPTHHLDELAAAADLVLDPSDEPVARPLVAAALAAGVPVVAAPGGGAESLIGEIGGGVVVGTVGDPDGLAGAVQAVLGSGLKPDVARAREVLARQRSETAGAITEALRGAAIRPVVA